MKKILVLMSTLLLGLSSFAATPPKTTVGVKNGIVLTKDNTIVMDDYFSGEKVAQVTQKAKDLDAKLQSNEPLYLVLDSGGGSTEAGIELIENLNNLNRPVKTVTLFAASMGFQTVEGLRGERLITENGTLMSHKARGGFYGEFPGQLDSRYNHYLRRVQRLDAQVVKRTNGKHTAKSYAALIENEHWCDGADCIAQGFADRVVKPSCDQSLKGTHNALYDRFIYMGHVVEIVDVMSNCPLITEALSWNVYIDGEPLFASDTDSLVNSTKVSTDINQSGYSRFNRTVLDSVGLEAAENIKKLVTKKLDAREGSADRNVKKY
jgi:ATP-dependent protease ClpP protease subunit